MCFNENGNSSYKLKCIVIAITSLIFHALLICLSITAVIKIQEDLNPNTNTHFNFRIDKTTLAALSSIALAMGVFGFLSSVMLLFGTKCNKPGFVVVYFCYCIKTCILLLIGGLIFLVTGEWRFAIALLCLFVLAAGISIIVNISYENMVKHALLQSQNCISDLTCLIQEDSSEDLSSRPVERELPPLE